MCVAGLFEAIINARVPSRLHCTTYDTVNIFTPDLFHPIKIMRTTVATVAVAASGASAAHIPRAAGCSFQLTASGGPGGPVGQLGDGQNRIGQTSGLAMTSSTYAIDINGGVTDSSGRGCIFTPPTTQWQCDVGAARTFISSS